jgi:drug/metabolite transporter (DMT)-like permease
LLLATGRLQRIKNKHLPLLLISTLFNPFLYFIGENHGVKLTTPTITAIFIATIPLFTPLAAWMMIREKLSFINLLGIVISFGGILIMLINPDISFDVSAGGMLFLMLAVFSAVVYSIFLKKLTEFYRPFSIIAWQNLIGMLFFLPLFLSLDLNEFMEVRPDPRLISSLLFLAVFASSLAFIFFTYTIKMIGVSRANVYANLIPVVTAFTSFFVLGELFSLNKIAGIIIVIAGVILTQIKKIKTQDA